MSRSRKSNSNKVKKVAAVPRPKRANTPAVRVRGVKTPRRRPAGKFPFAMPPEEY